MVTRFSSSLSSKKTTIIDSCIISVQKCDSFVFIGSCVQQDQVSSFTPLASSPKVLGVTSEDFLPSRNWANQSIPAATGFWKRWEDVGFFGRWPELILVKIGCVPSGKSKMVAKRKRKGLIDTCN